MSKRSPVLLVTGATGHLGRAVLEALLEAGAGEVIAAGRDPRGLAALAARGVSVRRLDYGNADSHGPALEGVDRLLLVSTDLDDAPGIRLRQHQTLVDAALKAGVQHVVYTSITCPRPGSNVPCAMDHHETESHLACSGVSHTVLRNNLYMERLPSLLRSALVDGQLVSSTADGACAYVARGDCARVAAAVLRRPPHGNARLDVSGPAAVSDGELARIAARIARRPIGLTVRPVAVRRAALAASGMPPAMAERVVARELAAASGELACTSDAVQSLTGRKPQSVREFLAAHPHLFNPPAARTHAAAGRGSRG